MAHIKVDGTGRVTAASTTHHCGAGEIETNLPDGASLENIHEYKFIDGQWVHDPRPSQEPKRANDVEERLAALERENANLKETLEIILSGTTGEVEADG